jgi:hypothetical protein
LLRVEEVGLGRREEQGVGGVPGPVALDGASGKWVLCIKG